MALFDDLERLEKFYEQEFFDQNTKEFSPSPLESKDLQQKRKMFFAKRKLDLFFDRFGGGYEALIKELGGRSWT